MKKNLQDKKLYVILDRAYIQEKDLLKTTEALLEGGARLIQYRDKTSERAVFCNNAIALRKLIPESAVFIVNDDPRIALEIGADGVHLGQDDMPVDAVRKMLGPEFLIGLSTHSLAQVLASRDQDIDYIGFGPIYKTQTKPQALPIGLDELPFVLRYMDRPVYPIGGITLDRLSQIKSCGGGRMAIVSAILLNPNISGAVRQFIELLHEEETSLKHG